MTMCFDFEFFHSNMEHPSDHAYVLARLDELNTMSSELCR